jgi:hypothetical protein
LLIAVYGIVFFLLLYISNHVPKDPELRKLFSSSYTLFEYVFFTTLLFWEIHNRKFRNFILILSACFFGFLVYYFLTQPFKKLDTVPIGIETILLFIYIFLFFYQFIRSTLDNYVYNHPCFWIAVGVLIYLGGSFFFNLLVNHLSYQQVDKYWFLTYITEILKNILFGVALIMYLRHARGKPKNQPIPNLDFSLNN